MRITTGAVARRAIVISTESGLNQAIAQINGGSPATTIDVQEAFTLTANVTGITASLTITSSNGSAINDGGYSFLNVSNGAVVSVSLQAGGSGLNYVDGSQVDSTIRGLTGGAIADVELTNSGKLLVDSSQTFQTGRVTFAGWPPSGVNALGRLDNLRPIVAAAYAVVSNANGLIYGDGRIGDLELCDQSQSDLKLAPGTVFTAGTITVGVSCAISGPKRGAALRCRQCIVRGDPPVAGATVSGIDVTTITLKAGGAYCGWVPPDADHGTVGATAGVIANEGGLFDLGTAGAWTVGHYTQTAGTLSVEVEDFDGVMSYLIIEDTARFDGGTISVNALKSFVAPGTETTRTKFITARSGFSGKPIASLVQFNSFPAGVVPSVELVGNDLYLVLTVTG